MSKYKLERPRHLGEIQCLDEQTRVADLPSAAAAHETPKLLFLPPSSPCGLLLERAERSKVTLSVNDLLHRGVTECADQLVLQVCDAHEETEPFHVVAREAGAEAGPLETAPELALLCGVTETRQPDVQPLRAEPIQEASYRLRPPKGNNGNSLGLEIPTTAPSERLERDLVAGPLNEHDAMHANESGTRATDEFRRGRRSEL